MQGSMGHDALEGFDRPAAMWDCLKLNNSSKDAANPLLSGLMHATLTLTLTFLLTLTLTLTLPMRTRLTLYGPV